MIAPTGTPSDIAEKLIEYYWPQARTCIPASQKEPGILLQNTDRSVAKRLQRTTFGIEWSSKSSRERTIPLPPIAVDVLGRLRAESDGSPYVFLSLPRLQARSTKLEHGRLPAKVLPVNNINTHFHEIQGRARALLAKKRKVKVEEIDWSLGSPHDLRKTYETIMAKHVPMHELKELLGHAKIDTTARYYLKVGDEVAAKVTQAFPSPS